MLDLAKAPIKDLLGFAIRSEIDSNKTYSDLADRVSNPLLEQKFRLLAFEEHKHREVLEKLYSALLPGEKLVVPDDPNQPLKKVIIVSPSTSLLDILIQAMDSEKKAEDYYAGLAEKVGEPHRKVLDYLSKVEHSHYLMIRGEYLMVQEFEDYGEKDIDKIIT